ncbi:MAG: hypothetical protein NPIRA04_34990 [Nitrospirales bacterium]|nr:MAG: hypothetical protein NPIRA04_34990 [Nitrospirales bacterium]
MMTAFTAYLLLLLELSSLVASCDAEVRLTLNTFLVDIDDVSINDILDDLRDQGDFNIVALEERKIGNVKISKKFWNLPLEEGLDRLLSGWNYGVTRDVTTGTITTLYLVSQRSDSSIAPDSLPTLIKQNLSLDIYATQLQTNTFDEANHDSIPLEPDHDTAYRELVEKPYGSGFQKTISEFNSY